MRRTEIIWKWIKVLILASLAVYLSVLVCGFAGFAWSESRHNFTHAVIDPRSLEHLELFYIAVLFLVVLGLLLSLTIAGLVRTLCPSKQPGIITKHLRQYGLYMAPAFVVLFVAFRFFFRIIEHNASVL